MGIIEATLRFIGYQPGDISPNWINFEPVDSLIIYNDFVVNDKGILVANQDYYRYQPERINTDGFRTSELDSSSVKGGTMLIGDSFVWGMTAEPIDSCFADRLGNDSTFQVINLGIPAADPPQYSLLAETYIPKLQPKQVLVYFFMGNDLMKRDREPKPNKPFYFYTNAGAILTNIDGNDFKTAQEAYNYIVARKFYLKEPIGILESITSKSSLLSRLYSLKFRLKEKLEYEQLIKKPEITIGYLKQIVTTCKNHNTLLKIVVIPEIKEADMDVEEYRSKYSAIFDEPTLKPYLELPQTTKNWFNDYPDAHLNNLGHYKYYLFSRELIMQELAQ